MRRGVPVITSIVALLAIASCGIAYSPGDESPPRRFDTYDELDSWARSGARYGGMLRAVGPWNEDLYCVTRYYDRDRLSAESAIYRYEGWRGYQLMLYLPAEHFAGRNVSVQGDLLVVSQWKPSSPDTCTLQVPLAILPGHGGRPESAHGMMDLVDMIGYPDESGVAVGRDEAMDIARGALSEEGLLVHTLRLRESRKWGAVWRVESLLPEPPPGMDSSGRTLLIDAHSGEIVHDIHWLMVSEKTRASRPE